MLFAVPDLVVGCRPLLLGVPWGTPTELVYFTKLKCSTHRNSVKPAWCVNTASFTSVSDTTS